MAETFDRREQHVGATTGSFSPLNVSGRQVQPIRLQNNMKGVSRTLLGDSMPSVDLQPPYKAWGYLVRNELARGVGRQMYYTDEIGTEKPRVETIEKRCAVL